MKKINILYLLIGILSFLIFSCPVPEIIETDPDLVASVYYESSESTFGIFGLGVKIENLGTRKAENIEYNLFLSGSLDLVILYTLNYSSCDIEYECSGEEIVYTSFIGTATQYIPYFYDLFISWEDNEGNDYGPILVNGAFSVDFSSVLPVEGGTHDEKILLLKNLLSSLDAQ